MKYLISIVLLTIILSSCFKQQAMREVEDQLILNYIFELGLDFDTTTSGAIFHKTYTGENEYYSIDDKVPLIITGFYFNKKRNKITFVENDTFNITIGDREIMEGWNEILQEFKEGGSGIIIFPYYTAFDSEQTPNIEPNSTLYYYFRIISQNYRINQTALFWNYAEKYDSIMTIFDDSLCYIKYFDGLGGSVSQSNTEIDFTLTNIDDSLITYSYSHVLTETSNMFTMGLREAISNMQEGEMGKIIVPPNLAFTEENMYNIKPYSAIVYDIRTISADPEIEEKSKIDKYLYVNNVSPDSILTSGIYYFENKEAEDESISAFLNANISYSDSLYLINHSEPIESCNDCTGILNSSNFDSGILQSILMMKEGEHATFIIPYSEGYGSNGQGNIPPYSTLVYKIELKEIN